MSSNNDISPVLVEYMNLLRDFMLYHNNMVISYSRTTETLSSQLSRIILNISNNNSQTNNDWNNYSQRSNFFDNNIRRQNRTTSNMTWPYTFSTPLNNTFTTPRRTTTRVNTAPQRRRDRYNFSWANPVRTRTRTNRRRDLVQQILNNSLYTSTTRNPASNQDISRNTSIHTWSDIQSTTDQSICPITQENFSPTDTVMRINHCGHLFMRDALTTYFTEFDHRCPICRYNIRRNIPSPTPSTTATQTTNYNDISNNSTLPSISRNESFWGDISFNFVNSTSTDSIIPETNFSFNDAINQLSNAMANQITTAINNPDNSGNMIAAEYSLFIPQNFTDN